MPLRNMPPKRKRGVVLTLPGWHRLQATRQALEAQENSNKAYTLEELNERTSLSPNTLTKIHHRQVGVDRQSLECYFSAFNLTLKPDDYTQLDSEPEATEECIEFPGSPVPLNSAFYIERSPLEERAYSEIRKPGSVVRIKAPRKMGKSSLLLRLIAQAAAQEYQIVSIDFQQADEAVFASLDKFLRWLCANATRQLKLESYIDEYWDEEIGSKVSCTIYFQGYLLEQIDSPVVLAFNEVNRIFEYPKIAREFLPLLRSWHEEAQQDESLQKLRLVVVHSTEVYVSLTLNQSPFNIGLPITLPEFTLEQLQDLAVRHGLDWTDGYEAEKLMGMVGGHPYLLRLALYHLCCSDLTLEPLLQNAPTAAGIYSHHLRSQLATLQKRPELADVLKQVVTASDRVRLDAIAAYKLESMGLVKLEGNEAIIGCELYRLYFGEQLFEEPPLENRLEQLEEENQQLQRLCSLDNLTRLPNRRSFDEYLEQEWQQLVQAEAPLSIILADIDFFKIYNDTFGHLAGDGCLQKVAKAIGDCADSRAAFVARFGGEEFAVIMLYSDANSALQLAEEIREQVKALGIAHDESRIGGFLPIITISLGVASTIPKPDDDLTTIIDAADNALYESKRWGRDRVTLCSSLNFRFEQGMGNDELRLSSWWKSRNQSS
ncbi:AAA-like domain-containing protein [Coleofasciculus sp. LEGE 07092]|nr:AAA-like domain-containing protein [Coleofasciculus sp. LEGE 07081]MBE9148087.1 AAA-like domain-containing protein [Coleofasciculus sp. LEGE 07092]